jgi:glycine C-acetyltransferase
MDGVFLHKAKGGKSYMYQHNDMDKCKKMLEFAEKTVKETKGGILIITEGVYGMSGDVSKIDEIVKMKKQFNFRLLVDDAHGFGTMGANGKGSGEHFGIQDEIDVYFSTFAKSMAGIGAFVTGPVYVIDYLKYNMRSQVFAKSLPMPMVIGAMKRLEMLKTDKSLRENLWKVVNALQNGLKERGFNLGNTNSPVTPVFLKGGVPEATNITKDLRENFGIFCSIVTYPVVPKGVILLRIIPTASHTLEQVEETIKAFEAVGKKLSEGKYSSGEIAEMYIPNK